MPQSGPKPHFGQKISLVHFRIFIGACIGVLAVMVVLAFWIYRDDVFQSLNDPGQPFQTYTPPPEPDYSQDGSQDSAWLHRPAPGIDPISVPGGDVFVVIPTFYLGKNHWNAPINSEKLQHSFTRIALPNYILPYKNAGRVYAPAYRQAALYTFLTNRDDAVDAQIFAYGDVRRAFKVFLNETPPERPIVLVGYGQGGLHVQKLLQEFFAYEAKNGEAKNTEAKNEQRQKKLAVAYIIDHPLTLDSFDRRLSGLGPCTSKQNTNCIVAFGAFEPKEKKRARMFVQKTMVWDDRGRLESVQGRPLLCINPLLWTDGLDYAPARLHLGGVAAEGLGEDVAPAPMPQQTGAQCQGGILLLDKPKQKNLRRPSRFGGKYRTLPFNLFYEDLRVDAQRRVQYLLGKDILPKRAPLLETDTIEIEDSPVKLPVKP